MPQDTDPQISLEDFEEQRRTYYGIPKGLAESLKSQESGGRHYDRAGNVLTSPKEAKGRFQVLQDTADRYGLSASDPFENIEAGFRYLSDLHKQVDKSITDPGERWSQTLAGYHAGDKRLREMNKTGEFPTTSDGKIRTDEYVDSIMRRWQQYDTGETSQRPVNARSMGIQPAEGMRFDLRDKKPRVDKATGLPSDLIPSAPLRPQTGQERRAAANEVSRRKAAPEIAKAVEEFEGLKQAGDLNAAKAAANKIKRQYGRWMEVGEGDGWPYVKSRIPGWDPVGPKAGPVGAEPPPRGAQGALNQFLQSAIKGTSAIPEGFAELVRSLPRNDEIDVFNKLIEEGKTPEEAQKELPAKLAEYQTQRNRNEAIKRDFRPITDRGAAFAERVAPIDPTDKSYLTAKIPAALGGTVPFAVGTVLTGGNPVTGAVLGASANAQQVAREFDAAGVDPEKRDRAIRMAGATGLTEMFGISRALNKFGMSRPFIKRAVDILEESGQEGLQQYLNNVNAVMNYDPNRPLDQGVLENVITGGVTGGVLQGASAAGAKMASRASLNPAAQPAVAETGVVAEPPQSQALPMPRNTRGAIIAPESPIANRRLLPPASTQPMPALDAPETTPVIYPNAPVTDQIPTVRERITLENAPTTEEPIVMPRRTAELSQGQPSMERVAAPSSVGNTAFSTEVNRRTAELPKRPAIAQEPTNRISEGKGGALQRYSRPLEGQPVEMPSRRTPTQRLQVPQVTEGSIEALRARRDELGRLAYDRRGEFTGDLRDEYNELSAALRDYDNERSPRELAPPPGPPERMTPPTAEIPARRQALESRPRTSGLLQASTPGRPVTEDAQIPSSRNPRTDFSSREDARQGYFDTLTDDELVAEIGRMEDVKNTAVRGKSKLTPDEISANNFDLKIATAMQKERRRLQQQIGVDPANRIPVRTPGRAERKIQHGTFGLVTEVADQSGVPKGKLKVVGEDGASHIIQNPRTRGNREATFVKAATPKYEIPAEAMPEMKGRSMPRPITPRQPTSTGAIPAEAMPEMRQPRGQIMGMGFGSLQGLFERGGKAKQVAPEGVEPPPSPGRDVRWYDYLRSPLSNLNYKGTYERLAGKAGEEISEAFRQAQLNIAKDESSRGTQIRQLEKTLRGYKEQLRAEGKPGLANWLDEHVNGLHDPDSAFRGLAGFLKGFQYHSKLRFNPRSIIVNELQPLQTLWPHLTTREFLKIAAQARRKETRTRIAELLGKEVAGKVEGVDAKRRFDPFATVSESNRAMGYLAGELMANRMGLTGDAKARMAADWAKKVEFDNSRWDVPPLFRGRLASVVGQFKPFMIKNLERLYADWKEAPQGSGSGNLARRSKMIASQLAIGGVRSMLLPGIKEVGGVLILGGLANALTKAGMDEDDANKLAEAVYFGAPGLIEQDLSGSVMLLDTPMGNTPAEKTVNFLGGPTISLIVKAWKEGETLAGAKDSKEMKESALRLAKTVTPYTKTAETVYNLAVERKAPNLKLGKKETPMTTAETIGYGLMGTPLRQTKHYEEEETFDWQRRMLGKPRKAGELGAFGGRLDAELRKHGLDYSKVSEIPGDTEETQRDRTIKVESWFGDYGNRLIDHPRYQSLTESQQKEAIKNLRGRIGAQANQKRPDLGQFRPQVIISSVRESERTQPRRNRAKLVVEPE